MVFKAFIEAYLIYIKEFFSFRVYLIKNFKSSKGLNKFQIDKLILFMIHYYIYKK